MAKIVIHLEGGMVSGVYLFYNNLFPQNNIDGAIVVDFDTDMIPKEDVTSTRDRKDALLEAVVHQDTIDPLPEGSDLRMVTAAFLERSVIALTSKQDLPLLVGCLEDPKAKKILSERLKGEGK